MHEKLKSATIAVRKFLADGVPTKTGTRRARFVISSDCIDGMGEQVCQNWSLKRFNQNPIAIFGHDGGKPFGTWHDLATQNGKTTAELRFPPPGVSALADEIWGLIESGVLRCASVGFNPINWEPMDPSNPRGPKRYLRSELCEISVVSVPANPDATLLSTETRGFHYNTEKDQNPMNREQRLAYVRALAAGADPRPAPQLTPTQYIGYSGKKDRASMVEAQGRHAYTVVGLQRASNPEVTDRLARAEHLAAQHRLHGLAGDIEEKETAERAACKSVAPAAPAWTKGW